MKSTQIMQNKISLPFSSPLWNILIGVLALSLAAQMSIPLKPVPLTFQTTMVLLIGLLFTPRHALAIISSYLLIGAMGLPIFSDASFGLIKLIGPTGGYLLGFLPAVMIAGLTHQPFIKRSIAMQAVILLLATSIIFLLGVLQLSCFIGFNNAIQGGLMPFLLTESVKLIALISLLWFKQSKFS